MKVKVDSLWPHGYTVHGILQARILEWVAIPFSKGSSQPRDGTQVSCIAGRIFASWATREAQLKWVADPFSSGSSLTQESNRGLLHCRRVLYQLSYKGSPLRESKAGFFKVICVCVFVYLSFEMLIALLHWIDRYSI